MSDINTRIAHKATELWRLARDAWGWDDGLPSPVHKFNLRGKTAGMYRFSLGEKLHTSEFRWNLQAARQYPEDYLRETVPHEVAHAVVEYRWRSGHYRRVSRPKPHGPEWQAVMLTFGVNPDRAHSYQLAPARQTKKYPYTCGCPGHVMYLGATRHRRIKQEGRKYYCRHCRQPVSPA